MASLKLTLDTRRKYKDGRHPLIIRLSNLGKSTSIHINIKLFTREWDNKNHRITKKHSDNESLNLHIRSLMLGYERKLLELNVETKGLSIGALKKVLLDHGKSQKQHQCFYDFALEQISKLESNKRFGNAQSYKTAVNRVIDFKGPDIKLLDIDYAFVLDFESFLANKGISSNGIAAYMRALRALLNIAMKLNLYDNNLYPFSRFKIRTSKTPSRAITLCQIESIINMNIEKDSKHYHARNIFLLIFSLIGISFMDLIVLKKSNIQGNRIVYRRRKTGKIYSVRITNLAKSLLDEYQDNYSDYLLPQFGLDGVEESKLRYKVNLGIKSVNKYLKQIGEQLDLSIDLTTYVARYSWANIAKSKGYSKDLIAEALGHSYGNQVTGIYLEGYGNNIIDDANRAIQTELNIN